MSEEKSKFINFGSTLEFDKKDGSGKFEKIQIDAAIVSATIALAHNLGLRVIAEGIEHRDQLLILKSQGCDLAQGYFFSRPLAATAFVEWIRGGDLLARHEPLTPVPGNSPLMNSSFSNPSA